MNFVKSGFARMGVPNASSGRSSFYFLALWLTISLIGCSDQVRLPSALQLTEFENAGPVHPTLDKNRLIRAKMDSGPYRVVPGEVLEITMPAILQAVTPDESIKFGTNSPYICRIRENGIVELPVVGELYVQGKTCAHIETSIIDKYYPEYAVIRPSVLVRVLEHKTAKVTISGAVQKPGIYSLRRDQMSLVALLMEAGGIVSEGAMRIEIICSGDETRRFNAGRDDETFKNYPGQDVERNTRLTETEQTESPSHYRRSKELGVKLTFRPITTKSTTGTLIVTCDENVLLNEQLDVTSRIEREVMLELLARREPLVSLESVEQKLCALAEQLKPGSTVIEVVTGSANSKHQNNGNMSKQRAKYVSQLSTVGADPELWKPARVIERGFGVYNSEQRTSNKRFLDIVDVEKSNEYRGRIGSNTVKSSRSLILPVKGFNIPFVDVPLQDGDSVLVERLCVPLFTVVGLVNKPGNFPYPPDTKYNLMQALAFAGGLNQIAEPRYATVYRLKPDGTIVNAAFEIINAANGSTLTDSFNVRIKPGDVIFVEHTPRTRSKLLLDRMFNVNVGVYYGLHDVFGN